MNFNQPNWVGMQLILLRLERFSLISCWNLLFCEYKSLCMGQFPSELSATVYWLVKEAKVCSKRLFQSYAVFAVCFNNGAPECWSNLSFLVILLSWVNGNLAFSWRYSNGVSNGVSPAIRFGGHPNVQVRIGAAMPWKLVLLPLNSASGLSTISVSV